MIKKISNKQKGSKFENDFAEYLYKKGYWVHLIANSAHTGSQPCDIIAMKNDFTELYDCKTLENKNGIFTLERVEQNQINAYKKIRQCGNKETIFALAILWNNTVYIIEFDDIDFSKKSIDLKEELYYMENFYENQNR